MMVVLDGPWPAWISKCDNQVLLARVGAGAHSRGVTYARQRAVLKLTVVGDGQVLSASVRGSGRAHYETLVRAKPPRAGRPVDFSGHCTCPVKVDCKHVAAALITARDLAGRAGPTAQLVPGWETQLAGLLTAGEPESAVASIGLQLEVVPSDHRGPSKVRVRAVTTGKNGRWVRTGMGWRDLEHSYGYGAVTVPPTQREVLRSLLATFRVRQPAYSSGYSEPQVHLEDLGPSAWRWLVEAQHAGIALVSATAGQQVQLATTAATLVMDLRQPAPGQDARLALLLRQPSGDVPAEDVVLVGAPAHGAYVATGESLRLIPFERAVDADTHRLLTRARLEIPASDLPVFLRRYYPTLRQRLTVESGDASVDLPEIEPPRLALQVRFEPGHETVLDWAFAYPVGGQVVRVHGAVQDDEQVARDRPAEQRLLDAAQDLPGLWTQETGRRHLAPRTLLTGLGTALFVRDTLPGLLGRDDVTVEMVGTPADYVEADEAPLITVSARDAADGSTDWFDLFVDVSVAGQQVPLTRLLVALAQEQEHLLLDSGTWFALDRPELHSLRRLVEEARSLQDKESTGLRLTPFHAGLWEELVSLGVVEHQSTRWSRTVGGLLDLQEIARPEPPMSLKATLRPYQLEGYHWLSLLWDHQLGGILADDMGLGKTVQTLAMVARARDLGTLGGPAGPLLVVAPTSVVGTWASEAARFVPDLAVAAITETQHRSGQAIAEIARAADLVITSYALFRIDEDAYREVTWSGLVLDEAQFVKNHQARTYQCARRLPAPFKLAITGTPLENSLMDLWSMLSITAPGLFPNPQRFTELFRKPIESGESPEQLAVLRRRIRPLMLRRSKDQVAPDLPPKIEQVLQVALNPQHRKVYDKHLARERQRILGLLDDLQRNRIAILRSLTLLRQLSLDASLVDDRHAGKVRSSKIDVLLEQLREVVDEGHRVLVFSQFTGFLSLVRARLDAEGIGYCYLDGRTRNRPARIAEFTDGDAPVFLISLKAGGVGLTLTEADYVFVLDPWWNPAAEAQAVDRTHRIGQTKTVMVYRLVATDTIEEKVVALQERKRDLFARVVDDEAMTGSAMTAEDIRGLFT